MAFHNKPDTCTCTRPRNSYCVVGDLTAQLWWHYGDPTELKKNAVPIRATAFVLSKLIVRAIVRRSMRCHSVYSRCHCVTAEIHAPTIVLRAPQRSDFPGRRSITVRTLLWCDRGLTLFLKIGMFSLLV